MRPGAVTAEMIYQRVGITVQLGIAGVNFQIKAPGVLQSHYAPAARVFLSGDAQPGDGFIAYSLIPTPIGAIRLASPKDNIEYAQILYESLRFGDIKGLKRIFVVPPINQGIGIAINDRLVKAATHSLLI